MRAELLKLRFLEAIRIYTEKDTAMMLIYQDMLELLEIMTEQKMGFQPPHSQKESRKK